MEFDDHNDSIDNVVEPGRTFVASNYTGSKAAPLFNVGPSRHREEENSLDPDDANSVKCGACELPIFSTPFIIKKRDDDDDNNDDEFLIHDACDNLPEKLTNHVLHLGGHLDLKKITNHNNNVSCSNCKVIIHGRLFYSCPDKGCSFKLDVLCALTTRIKILHRSHEHRLMVIRGTSFICRVCGTQHAPRDDASQHRLPAYMCNDCGFWIHPDCASLPNAIRLHDMQQHYHGHTLLLTYALTRRRHAELKEVPITDHNHVTRPNLFENSFIEREIPNQGGDAIVSNDDDDDSNFPTIYCNCNICGRTIGKSGVYFCGKCPYYAHVKCINDPDLKIESRAVPIQYAYIPDLVNFPVADEGTSVTVNILVNTDSAYVLNDNELSLLHEHKLKLCDDEDDVLWRVCNACAGLIDSVSDEFYRCDGGCTNFFLHYWCNHYLPSKLTKHRAHKEHPIFLYPKAVSLEFSNLVLPKFRCKCCSRACNGFAYSCREKACADFHLDVVCALMPPTTTHESHGSSTHILYLSRSRNINLSPESSCICCYSRERDLYECRTCSNFKICVSCILLPQRIKHRFDQHDLSLKTASFDDLKHRSDHFCEICESGIMGETETNSIVDKKWCWYYGCDECDQSFHINCIPSLGSLSKIKLGLSVDLRCHESCSMKLVRAFTVAGYRCGCCRNTIRPEDELAFECSKCYYRIHEKCAAKELLLLNSSN